MDIVRMDVPLFIRLLELAREDIKNDADLHDIGEIVARASKHRTLTMAQYDMIVGFMKKQGNDDDVKDIKRLSGLN